MRTSHLHQLLLVLVAVTLTACASGDDTQAASGPCALMSEARASEILEREVEKSTWTEVVEAQAGDEEITPKNRAGLAGVEQKLCVYATEDRKQFVGVQLDRGLMTKDEFNGAWEDDVEVLDEPGIASAYDQGQGGEAHHLSVLLNEEGDTFDLIVSGRPITKGEMVTVGEAMVKDY